MADNDSREQVQNLSQANKAKKHKKKKSKAPAKANGDDAQPNGSSNQQEDDADDGDDDDRPDAEHAAETPVKSKPGHRNPQSPGPTDPSTNGETGDPGGGSDPAARLEAAARERDQLRSEVTEIRKSLEQIQKKHDDDKMELNKRLEEAQLGKDHADSRYQKLLGQVNTIKSTLHDRLKADAEELAKANSRIEELEDETKTRSVQNESLQTDLNKIRGELEQQTQEMNSVRGRTNTSQQNWAKERDDLVAREARAREEFDAARQAMQDWEVLAMEERSLREGMEDRVSELEEQLVSQREAFERADSERESQSATVDGLQRALRDIHDARKEERRELVESSQAQLEELRTQASTAEISLKEAQETLEKTQGSLEKALPFEKEVREKNLLIGKLRQEAIILNDHLTKALRFLKRGKKDDQVDRQLVTNYLLHFLALDRTDPKKFQVLQLISSILGWTDEQQEQAGLSRPGASSQTALKIPLSTPFRRVSSTTTLSPLSSPSGNAWSAGTSADAAGRESLAELWSDFLEREAEVTTPSTPKAGSSSVQSPPGSSAGGSEDVSGK